MKKTAFSLIELTIVLIIIGLLATVVIGSQSLINSATLSSARSKTKASPVNHIENLVFWLDSTSENSFDGSESSDESLISIWKDLNLQKTTGCIPIYKVFLIKISLWSPTFPISPSEV